KARFVNCEENKGVSIETGRVASRFEDTPRFRLPWTSRLFRVRIIRTQYNKTSIHVIGYVLPGSGHRMNATKVTSFPQIHAHTFVEFLYDFVRIPLELLGTILCKFGDRWLRGVPVAWTILVEERGSRGETSQGVPEDRGGFLRHYAAQLDSAVLETAVGSGCSRGGNQIDRTRHTPAGGMLAEIGYHSVQPKR